MLPLVGMFVIPWGPALVLGVPDTPGDLAGHWAIGPHTALLIAFGVLRPRSFER